MIRKFAFLGFLILFILTNVSFAGGRISITGSNLQATTTCANDTIRFFSNPDPQITNRQWKVLNSDGSVFLTGTGNNFSINGNMLLKAPPGDLNDNFIAVYFNADSNSSAISWVSISLTVVPTPEIIMPISPTLCQGNAANLVPTVVGVSLPDANYINFWTTPSLTTVNSVNLSATAAGTYSFFVKIKTGSQCSDRKTLQLTPTSVPIATVVGGATKTRCAEQTFLLEAKDNANSGTLSYAWSPATNLSSTIIANPRVGNSTSVLPTTYTVTITNNGNCSSSFSVEVRTNPTITGGIILPNNSTLCKFPATNIGTDIGGGTAPFSYSWLPNIGLDNPNIANPNVTPLSFSGINYTLTGIDAKGCSVSKKVLIKRSSLVLSFKNSSNANICVGNVKTFELSRKLGLPPYNFNSDNRLTKINDTTYSTPNINTTGNFLYVITVTDASGCYDKDTIKISSDPAPNIVYGNQNTLSGCSGLQLQLSVTTILSGPISKFTWEQKSEISDINSSIPGISVINPPNSATAYLLTLTGADPECKSVITTYIQSNPTPQIAITRLSGELFIETPLNLNSSGTAGLINLLWQFGDGNTSTGVNTSHIYAINQRYIVTLSGENSFGCQGKDTLHLKLLKKSTGLIYVPNAFLPNSDNLDNKTFKIFCEDGEINTAVFSAKIYNIFGKIVYSTTNYSDMRVKGWDGEGFNSGVYTYVIEGQFVDEKPYSLPGRVNLIR